MEIVNRIKEIVTPVKKMNNMPLLKEVTALQSDVLVLQQENLGLKKSMSQLQEKLDLQTNMVYEDPFCWKLEGDRPEGPYCHNCWESKHLPVHLDGRGHDWKCPQCNNKYHGTPSPSAKVIRYGAN